MNVYFRRRAVNYTMLGLCGLAVAVALVPLASVLWLVISRGLGGLSPSFFTSLPTPVGEVGGGVGNAILGTLIMVGMACLVGIPVGIGAGVFLAERGNGPVGSAVRFVAEILSGVPSIVIGIVAYGLVVIPMRRFSALAGAVALAVLMIPTLARSTEEMVRLVPTTLREAALALGVPAWKTALHIVLRTALGGIATAALLAISRAAGETAPLLFTALGSRLVNVGDFSKPMDALPLFIYVNARQPYDLQNAQAWGAAFLLLVFVLAVNVLVRLGSTSRRRTP
jgi:phosphate transport system permease protein